MTRTHIPAFLWLPRAFRVLGFLLGLWLAVGLPLSAQGPELATWTVAVWPEYDQPAVLVISEGVLSDESTLPLSLRVSVPANAQINAVAYKDEEGRLFSLPWEVMDAVNGQEVVFELDQLSFVVEYYADVISPPPDRSFELLLTVPYDTQSTILLLRQPARASDMVSDPALDPVAPDGLGNPQYSRDIGPRAGGTLIPLSVSYVKADAETTLSEEIATSAAAEGPSSAQDGPNWVSWGVGILLGALLAGVGILAWDRFHRGRGGSSRQARRRKAREAGRGANASGDGNRFCPQCGKQYDVGDRFCRACGTPRR
jgi:hypothetical protein